MKQYIYYIAILCCLLTACSDDDRIFSESSSARMQQYLEKAQQTLMSADYGWAVDYYPERSMQGYGGFVYAIKFTDGEAQVASELMPDSLVTTLYSMKSDNGPVLSFDSFNMLMHFFATPSQQRYQAYDGDFEFVIDEITDDLITLHGKRNQNRMYMHRLTVEPKAYINKVNDFIRRFPIVGGVTTIDGRQDSIIFNASTRQATVITPDTTLQSAFVFYDEGVRLYKSVTVGDKTIGNFQFNDTDLTLTNTYAGATDIVFAGIISPALVQEVTGSNIGFPDQGGSRTYDINRLELYSIATNRDWCHLAIEDGKLVISTDPNTTGDVRTATVRVSVGIAIADISVSQADASDLVGNYYLAFYDSNNSEQYKDAEMSIGDDGQLALTVTIGGSDLCFPLSFDVDKCAVRMESGVVVGSVTNTYQGVTYYFAPIFMDANGTEWSNHQRGFFAECPLVQHSEYGTVGIWGGELQTTEIAQMFIGGYTSENISAGTYVAYLERLQSPILQKNYDESAARLHTRMLSANHVNIISK